MLLRTCLGVTKFSAATVTGYEKTVGCFYTGDAGPDGEDFEGGSVGGYVREGGHFREARGGTRAHG